MAGLRKKRRAQMVIVGLVLLAFATVIVGFAFKDGIQLYRSPTEVMADLPSEEETFKLGGLVVEGSLTVGEINTFIVTDTNREIFVSFRGFLPDLFVEGQMTIVTGKLIDGQLIAEDVLAKHDETYMPSEVVNMLEAQGVVFDPEA